MVDQTQIQCPGCGQSYGLTAEQVPAYRGQTIHCTRCNQPFTVSPLLGLDRPNPTGVPAPPMVNAGAPIGAVPSAGVPNYYVPQTWDGGGGAQTNGMAITSLVLGCMFWASCLTFVTAPVGFIFGILGLRRTRDPRVGGRGMAIAGIVLNSIGLLLLVFYLGAFAFQTSTLLPALSRSRETANRVKCAANLRQIGQAMMIYASVNGGRYPDKPEVLLTSNSSLTSAVFVCPSSTDTPASGATPQQLAQNLQAGGHDSYVYVAKGLSMASPAKSVLAYENATDHAGVNPGMNVLFGDGHVSFVPASVATRMLAELNRGRNPPPSVAAY